MSGRVCTRLEHPAQGSRLFVLCWLAYASAYVGRYNYSAVMGCLLDEGALSMDRLQSYRKLCAESRYAGDAEGYLAEKKEKFKQIAKINRSARRK